MKYTQRREKILALLETNDNVSVQKIVAMLNYSEATARRDIVQMEKDGDVKRTWGGIQKIDTAQKSRNENLKNRFWESDYAQIGQRAAEEIQNNELIFIGSGATTLAMIPFIKNKKIQVITNGIPQLEALHRQNIQALLLCGFFKEYSRSVVGKETVEMLRNYHFDRAFLGANGLDDQFCPLSADEYEDSIKTICILQSQSTYLLVNHQKFSKKAYYSIPKELAKNVRIITDCPPSGTGNWIKCENSYIGRIGDLINLIKK